MKKLTAIILCVAMVACLLAGCGSSSTATTAPTAQDNTTVSTDTAASADVITLQARHG